MSLQKYCTSVMKSMYSRCTCMDSVMAILERSDEDIKIGYLLTCFVQCSLVFQRLRETGLFRQLRVSDLSRLETLRFWYFYVNPGSSFWRAVAEFQEPHERLWLTGTPCAEGTKSTSFGLLKESQLVQQKQEGLDQLF